MDTDDNECKPTAVTTNKGVDIVGELIIIIVKASQMVVAPQGHRYHRHFTKVLNSKPTAVTANKGARLVGELQKCDRKPKRSWPTRA